MHLPKQKFETSNELKNLHDTTYECLMSIKNLGINTENWDPMIVHVLMSKLSQATIVHFECQLKVLNEIPKLKDFSSYIESRFLALQSAEQKPIFSKLSVQNSDYSKNQDNCAYCDEKHSIMKCSKFL